MALQALMSSTCSVQALTQACPDCACVSTAVQLRNAGGNSPPQWQDRGGQAWLPPVPGLKETKRLSQELKERDEDVSLETLEFTTNLCRRGVQGPQRNQWDMA